MFTGIVEAVGTVVKQAEGRLEIALPESWEPDPVQAGESVSVSGCCLTVSATGRTLRFELTEETLRRTTLGALGPGHLVNLERALKVGDRLGGHFVLGHVDSVGRVLSTVAHGESLEVQVSSGQPDLLVDKGSVAIDGVSLTVVQPHERGFEVWLAPETLRRTTLSRLSAGDAVNIEFDILAKHVKRLVSLRAHGEPASE
jgi:riboflavin synthase